VTTAEKFMEFIGGNYNGIRDKMVKYCVSKRIPFDEDVFSDTIVRVHDKILKDGIEDSSEDGMMNYTFMSFRTNMMREKQYSRNKKNDDNTPQESIGELYDEYYNNTNDSSTVKLIKDLTIDFKTLKILLLVEKTFTHEQYHLFKLKFLEQLTYKQLAEKTGVKDARNKVLEVLTWLRENAEEISKDIEREFQEDYGDWLEFN
jgi:hypothetical protein